MVIFGAFGTVGTFGTQVPFGTVRIGIIPSEFWYIWCTLAQFTFGTPVRTRKVLVVHQAAFLV